MSTRTEAILREAQRAVLDDTQGPASAATEWRAIALHLAGRLAELDPQTSDTDAIDLESGGRCAARAAARLLLARDRQWARALMSQDTRVIEDVTRRFNAIRTDLTGKDETT